ncbi:MAG: alanine--tRNA ligase [Elusimicrobia bacterium]|nr:alanine--tRNA ligase [Elusimicrobiota bacterium]
MTGKELRTSFLNYFRSFQHTLCPSAPLIPPEDPTLLFNSAGMVPFKPYFLGLKKDLKRAASCQKCLRTTDIEEVGHTPRHLTFFEMLGNFSFGDYFKEEAIERAWHFLTQELKIPKEKLHISIFREDGESEKLWEKLVPASRILRKGTDTNFWNMGATGPCGPCSEILYDPTGEGKGYDSYLELWNLVFTQFDRQEDASLRPLPRKNIDTGLGLERLALVLQGKTEVFETDLLFPILQKASEILKIRWKKDDPSTWALRILADHARASSFLLLEGLFPSNESRGYVLRRLIRRALRFGKVLGCSEPFVYQLLPSIAGVFGETYPELRSRHKEIADVLRTEEERFLETLESGEALLQDMLSGPGPTLSGEEAFKLYDTYGYPLELTLEAAASAGKAVDLPAYERAKNKAQETARSGWKGSGAKEVQRYASLAGARTRFVGYEQLEATAVVQEILDIEARPVPELAADQEGEILLDSTPFYAEGGGQVGDRGWLLEPQSRKKIAQVLDTRRPTPRCHLHRIRALDRLSRSQAVLATVEPTHRIPTMCHHTATHLLNEGLRHILGSQVRQAGSLVAPDRLRFDFTWPKALSPEQIQKIEDWVNEVIRKDCEVHKKEWPASKAKEWGAAILLGEEYGEKPRFVLINEGGWNAPHRRDSLELCGGTHVNHTGEIRYFKILKDSSISAGIRRMEAVAAEAVPKHYQSEIQKLQESCGRVLEKIKLQREEIQSLGGSAPPAVPSPPTAHRTSPGEGGGITLDSLLPRHAGWEKYASQLRDQEKLLRQTLGNLRHKQLAERVSGEQVLREIAPGIQILCQNLEDADLKQLRSLCDQLKNQNPSALIVLASGKDDKMSFAVAIGSSLKNWDAAQIAKELASKILGKAGGRSDFAQGGGNQPADWQQMVEETIRKFAP